PLTRARDPHSLPTRRSSDLGLVEAVVAKFGRLDILVNNAGVFTQGVLGDPNADLAALDREQAINVGGVVAAVRAAVKHLPPGGRSEEHTSELPSRPDLVCRL